MSTTSSPIRPSTRAHFATVTNIERGDRIRRRRVALGLARMSDFARAIDRDRSVLQRAEDGGASAATYDSIEEWLARQEEENGHIADPEPARETIQLTVRGVLGVEEIIVTGPVEHPEVLAETLARVLEEMRNRDTSGT